MRSLLLALAAFSSALVLSSCAGSASTGEGTSESRPIFSFTGYNHTSVPNVPFLNLDVRKHTYDLSYNDRVCVFNGGDMVTDTGTRYKNSGRFMQKMVTTVMSQYNLNGIVDMQQAFIGIKDPATLQERARSESCNIIAVSYPVFWQDSQITPGNVGLRIEMFDTSSLDRLNYVTLNARSQYIRDMFELSSPLKPVLETYIDLLYTGKLKKVDY